MPAASELTRPSRTRRRKSASSATGTSSRTTPASRWRSRRSAVARATASWRSAQRAANAGSVRSRRRTSSCTPSQPASRSASSRMTCTRPCSATTAAVRAASSSARARNSASLSRKWWKIAPRDRPVSASRTLTVAPSKPCRANARRHASRICPRRASSWAGATLGMSGLYKPYVRTVKGGDGAAGRRRGRRRRAEVAHVVRQQVRHALADLVQAEHLVVDGPVEDVEAAGADEDHAGGAGGGRRPRCAPSSRRRSRGRSS